MSVWTRSVLRLAAFLFGASAIGSTGCVDAAHPYATIGDRGISFARYSYRVNFSKPGFFSVVSTDWQIANLHQDDDRALVISTGSEFEGKRTIDRSGRGKPVTERTFLFDLKLTHRTSNAIMWIQNQETGLLDSGKNLDTLLENYVESLSGTGLYVGGNMFSLATIKQKRFVAVVRDKRYTRIGKWQAVCALIQLVNLDRQRVDPNHQGDMMRVTIARIPFRYQVEVDLGPFPRYEGVSVMVVGYFNHAGQFASLKGDYEKLVRSIEFYKQPDPPPLQKVEKVSP